MSQDAENTGQDSDGLDNNKVENVGHRQLTVINSSIHVLVELLMQQWPGSWFSKLSRRKLEIATNELMVKIY